MTGIRNDHENNTACVKVINKKSGGQQFKCTVSFATYSSYLFEIFLKKHYKQSLLKFMMQGNQSIKNNLEYTACNVLDAFADYLYDRIVPANQISSFRKVSSQFPPVSGIGIEYHLNGIPRADLSIRISGTDNSREKLLSYAEAGGSVSVFNQADWKPLRAFQKEWSDASSELSRVVDTVWYEFDMNTDGTCEKLPALFFDINRHGSNNIGVSIVALGRALDLLGYPLQPEPEALLTKLLRSNSPVQLYYAGLKTNGKGDALRVCLKGISPMELFSYLDSIMENPMLTRDKENLWMLARNADRLILNLDISDRIHESIGVEVYFSNMNRWKDFFSDMLKLRLCSYIEAAETLSFPGVCCCNDEDFREYVSSVQQKEVHYLERRLNHIKVNVSPQSGLTAKAYLYACYH